ncbi:terpene cyclase/mutase family protein [Acidobacteria bacterium AH-259-G07]|nr:terpene cyclase/mutase family protein [Acidobacteria bacterium AH-259-G07]
MKRNFPKSETSQTEVVIGLRKAIDFLFRSQLPSGEFRTYSSRDPELLKGCVVESSVFGTSCVLYGLEFVAYPSVEHMRKKGFNFLTEEAEAPGVWRFWTSTSGKRIPPDLDVTCCASFVLKKCHPHILWGSNLKAILSNRNEEGLFYTWMMARKDQNDVDSVVNANVLLYLGEREETKPAMRYLNHSVLTDQVEKTLHYYVDDFSLYYAMSRAFFNGTTGLKESAEALITKLSKRQRGNGSFGNELQTAMAICSMLNLGCIQGDRLDMAVRWLLKQQGDGGAWPRLPFFKDPLHYYYGSEEITTAFCVEALARFGEE